MRAEGAAPESSHEPSGVRFARQATQPAVPRWPLACLAACLVFCLAIATSDRSAAVALYEALMAAVVAGAAGYVAWRIAPAYTLSLALFASVFSGNWSAMGLPAGLPPDHILETVGVLLVLLRAPAVADRRVRVAPVHWLMAPAIAYAAIDSLATSGHFIATFQLLDAFGLFPFLFFLVAPVAFRTEHERNILLFTLICLGVYLGFTALMESLHVNALVYPKYILNPLFGDPASAGRIRGPFAAAVQDGFGLYGCAVGAALVFATRKGSGFRLLAAATGILCLLGTLLTEQRSVWVATAVATTLILLIVPCLRAWAVPAIAAAALGVLAAFAVIPGLSSNVQTRVTDSEPVWERLNLNVAAENMIKAKPIFGFGWGRFASTSGPYFRQSASYPLVYTTVVHDVYLSLGAELGIVGLSLWLLVVALGIGGAMRASPPGMRTWRNGLVAYAVFYLIVIAFVPPPSSFPPLLLWLLAGVIWGQRSATVFDSHQAGGLSRPVGA